MLILFLCHLEDLKYPPRDGYLRAFSRRGIRTVCRGDGLRPWDDLRALIDDLDELPAIVLHVEGSVPPLLLPQGLEKCPVPTGCFHVDTFTDTDLRIPHSMLFDFAFLFHPGFAEVFKRAGHPGARVLPHAVDPELFHTLPARTARDIEVAWVGSLDRPIYEGRRRILPMLGERFRMNEWWRTHTRVEMADVYRRAKIGVNIAQDPRPYGLSYRMFEVMCSGAMLVTRIPSELEEIGFREGVHFAGWGDEEQLITTVRRYLADDTAREDIADAGRDVVMQKHSYDNRVREILSCLGEHPLPVAPARHLDPAEVQRIYFDHWIHNRPRWAALSPLGVMALRSPRRAVGALSFWGARWARRTLHTRRRGRPRVSL